MAWLQCGPGQVAFSDFAMIVSAAAAAFACLSAGGRTPPRTTLRLLGAGAGVWAFGMAVWTALQLGAGEALPQSPLVDVAFLIGGTCALAGLIALPNGAGRRGRNARLLVDGTLATCSLALFAWVALGLRAADFGPDLATQVATAALPFGDLVGLAMLIVICARATGARVVVGLLCAASAVRTVADIAYAWLSLQGTYATGHLLDTGWVASYVLLVLAARRAADRRTESGSRRAPAPIYRQVIAYAPVAVALVTATFIAFRDGRLVAFPLFDGLVVVALLLLRQAISVVENAQLLRRLRRDAEHDALTRLPNRKRLGSVLGAVASGGDEAALLMLDLDGFKDVNDTLGHPAGDALLVDVAARLTAATSPDDLVVRFGGDEFVIVVRRDARRRAETVARALLAALERPVRLAGRDVPVPATIGLAFGTEPDRLLSEADVAMYSAKARGSNVVVFEERLRAETLERIALERDLRNALAAGQFLLHYQPVVALATGELAHVEALVRWQHPERGLVPPAAFIGLAESLGLMCELGGWVLDEACAQAARWQGAGHPFGVTVNISAQQLADERLVGDVLSAVATSGLAPARLTLELTESLLVEQGPDTVARLQTLRAHGVRIAIDDFGTGYSSLAYLRHLPLDVLKIDKAFVDDVADDTTRQIIGAITGLAAALNLTIIAEGIEDAGQARRLRDLHCGHGQGYHWSRPLPAADLDAWWEGNRPIPGAVGSPRREHTPVAIVAGPASHAPTSPG